LFVGGVTDRSCRIKVVIVGRTVSLNFIESDLSEDSELDWGTLSEEPEIAIVGII